MNALETLITRRSCPKLLEPAPSKEQLDNMLKAAVRAADHGLLKPWRFLVVEGEKRQDFGQLMVDFALSNNPEMTKADQEKLIRKAYRAPMIVVAIASPKESPKIPQIEQVWSAVAATQMFITAAYAQDLGAIWRTGGVAFSEVMKQGLNLAEEEEIVGFVYLGTPQVLKPTPDTDISGIVSSW